MSIEQLAETAQAMVAAGKARSYAPREVPLGTAVRRALGTACNCPVKGG